MEHTCQKISLLAASLELLSGCMVGPKFTPPSGPVMEEYRAASGGNLNGQPTDPRTWWTVFNDSTLNCLIDKAYTENLDV